MAFRRPDLPLRWAACAVAILGIGCGREPVVGVVSAGVSPADGLECSIPTSQIFAGGPGKDGIPALTDPALTNPGLSGTENLRDHDRVIGLHVNGSALAVPLSILWWHEIVNLTMDTVQLAVTHCPLTGSSVVSTGALGRR